jgi:hypothetical protein
MVLYSRGDDRVDQLHGVTGPEDGWISIHASEDGEGVGEGNSEDLLSLRRFGASNFEKTCAEGPSGSTHIEP